MFRTRLGIAAAFSLALAAPASQVAAQAQQNFALVNRTGYQINELYVSPSTSQQWGRDILGDGVMPDGQRRNITFPQATRSCNFDLRIVYSDGERAERSNVDLCQVSVVTVTYSGSTRWSMQ